MKLHYEVLDPAGPPRATVIWLHGIGQDSATLRPVAERIGLPAARVRSIFPSAPEQSVSAIQGEPARAWFHQRVFRLSDADLTTMRASERALWDLLDAEAARTGADRVVLAGFSQGAAMAMVAGLRYPRKLGGLALYAPFPLSVANLAETRGPANKDTPIWIGHGRRDWIIPYTLGETVRYQLLAWGYDVTWRRFRGGHVPFGEAEDDVRAFVQQVMSD